VGGGRIVPAKIFQEPFPSSLILPAFTDDFSNQRNLSDEIAAEIIKAAAVTNQEWHFKKLP
jgi:hypothetical protein